LTREEVMAHAATYREQAFKILDPARTETVFNGDWFSKDEFRRRHSPQPPVTLQQCSSATISAEDREATSDSVPEIQYPIMQGWDSVMVEGRCRARGDRQLFNILVGRDCRRKKAAAASRISSSILERPRLHPGR